MYSFIVLAWLLCCRFANHLVIIWLWYVFYAAMNLLLLLKNPPSWQTFTSLPKHNIRHLLYEVFPDAREYWLFLPLCLLLSTYFPQIYLQHVVAHIYFCLCLPLVDILLIIICPVTSKRSTTELTLMYGDE